MRRKFLLMSMVAAAIFTFLLASTALAATKKAAPANTASLAGSYRCYSYNISGGGGGNCRLFVPIILKSDGTYSVSSEKGTYKIKGNIITLSKSKLRGPGTIIGGNQIRFEYNYNGWHHTITYLKESGSALLPSAAGSEVQAQIILEYPAKDSSLSGIVDVELVPQGDKVKTASYKPTAIAVYDNDRRIVASFFKANNTVKTGKYDVYVNTGLSDTKVGVVDFTKAKGQIKATIKVNLAGGTTAATQDSIKVSTEPEIVVEVDLVASGKQSWLNAVNFVTLVPENQDPATATYKPTALAVYDGDKTVVGSFHKDTNKVKTNARYDVYYDNVGLHKVGKLNLTGVTAGPIKQTFSL